MVLIEVFVIKGVISLSRRLQNQKRLRDERNNESKDREEEDGMENGKQQQQQDDDCTLTTTASTFDNSLHHSSCVSLTLQDLEEAQGERDDNESSFSCVTGPSSSLAMTLEQHNCSFRPILDDDSICFDIDEETLESLDFSKYEVYDLTRHARRGGAAADLEVAIQAAILAQEMISKQAIKKERALTRFLRARVNTFTKNTRTIEEFVHERIDLFTRNLETISMIMTGETDVMPTIESEISEERKPEIARV